MLSDCGWGYRLADSKFFVATQNYIFVDYLAEGVVICKNFGQFEVYVDFHVFTKVIHGFQVRLFLP